MNLELINLIKLQHVDDKIAKLLKIEKEGPEKLAIIEEDLTAAEEKVKSFLAQEAELLKRKRELESEIEDADEKLKANQTRQLQAKTNEEYRAFLRENDFLKKKNSANEDEILELMDKVEAISKEAETLKAWLEEKRADAVKKKLEIAAWLEEGLRDKDTLARERDSIVRDVSDKSMVLYKRVYSNRNGKAVVSIVGGICQQCHLQIPPQDFNELQMNQKVMTCPNCQRIIFWADHEDFEHI